MKIKVNRIVKKTTFKETFYYYSVEPKVENFEITLLVIDNWKDTKQLIEFAKNRIGYCDTDNGFGIEYQEEIDYKTSIEVPEGHLLVFADLINKKEFRISELNYLKILSQYLSSRKENSYAEEVERQIKHILSI